ncbi:MAG TPA: hypothetical protein VF611_16530, partial [Pyrinomonadaceae bacterium]
MKNVNALRRPFDLIRALGLAACCLLSVPLPALSQGSDEAALRALLEKFFSAYRAKDLEGLKPLWGKESAEFEAAKEALRRDFEAHEKQGLKNLAVVGLAVEGERGSARIAVEMGGAGATADAPAGGVKKLNRTTQFVKEGGEWKLLRYASSEDELAAALISAAAGVGRETLLEKEKELVSPALASALLARGRSLFMRGELSQALAVYELGLGVAEKIGDKANAVIALRQMANIHGSMGSYTQGLEAARRSLKLA